MSFLKICFLFFAFTLLNAVNVNAQGAFPILSMDVEAIPIANNFIDSIPVLDDSTIFDATMNVSLFDTTNIDEIYVSLGNGVPGNILQHTFDWDVSGQTGGGTNYSRNSYHLILHLGSFMNLLNYEATLSIKRNDGSTTDVIVFNR